MNILRPNTGAVLYALMLAGAGALAPAGAQVNTGDPNVIVDLSVSEDAGYGAAPVYAPAAPVYLPASPIGRRLLIPEVENPVSQLHLPPAHGKMATSSRPEAENPVSQLYLPPARGKMATSSREAKVAARPVMPKRAALAPPPAKAPKKPPATISAVPAPVIAPSPAPVKKVEPVPAAKPQAAPRVAMMPPPARPAPVKKAKPAPAAKPKAAPSVAMVPPPARPAPVKKAKPAPAAKPKAAPSAALTPPPPPARPAPVTKIKPAPAAKPTAAPRAALTPPPPPMMAEKAAKTKKTPAARPVGTPKAREKAALPTAGTPLVPGRAMRIVFEPKASTLPDTAKASLKTLAAKLKGQPTLRLQLMAYAGGESLSFGKARRLSLSRSLAVRSYLIENGVRSTRIDVRALGNKTAEEPLNRVDVTVAER